MTISIDTSHFTCEVDIKATPGDVFLALTKNIHQWWTTSAEQAAIVDTKASFRFSETYNTMLVKKLVENQLIVWECVDQYHADERMSVKNEWVGTLLTWEISPINTGTHLKFTHQGLTPSLQCYELCNNGWNHFIASSLVSYLETGTGQPFIDSKN